ncbi:MAG: hypothetical protein LUB59_02945 [Candidatus Gastranaerophilales bacterium]|nr:hypothetical protein [Candidatus Gastranaerophilales bacterium]
MKKFILPVLVFMFFVTGSAAFAEDLPIREKLNNSKSTFSNRYSVIKFFQDHVCCANQTDLAKFLKFYSPEYISNDGFNYESTSGLFKDLWQQYSGIKYKNYVNSVAFFGDTAIANVSEAASAVVYNDNNKKGTLKSYVDVIYYLKRSGKSWIITGENVITEEINIAWGEAKSVAMYFEAPQFVGAGEEYSAKLYIAPPKGVFAIGSISSEIVSYPQKPQKDVFKKFAQDYTIERVMIANSKNTNEYVIASIGYSKPSVNANNTFNMNLSGFACLIRRVNVVPKNKYIEIKHEPKEK